MKKTIPLFFLVALMTSAAWPLTPLPEGNTGIAAHYPLDANITANSAVVFADNFESYSSESQLTARWNGGVYHYVTFTTSGSNVFSGAKSLQFTNPQGTAELSNTVDRLISPKLDVLFLRYYSKFDTSFHVIGSSHNGCSVSASYFINGNATPGVPADGYNKFLANYENWCGDSLTRSPGDQNVYIYHPGQRSQWGDHFFPTGLVMPNTSLPYDFGPGFISRPDTIPDLGRWYCYEFMVKANTVGDSDGRIACWLDGKLIADFPNLKLRYVDTLKIDRFGISCHIKSNTVCETYKYYDNVVAATSYIGPMAGQNSITDQARASLRQGTALFTVYTIQGRVISSFKGNYDSMAEQRHMTLADKIANGVYLVKDSSGIKKVLVVR
jgi:hypothetical protein